METIKQVNFPPFDEDEWIRLIFLLNDTKVWLEELTSKAFIQLPITDRKKTIQEKLSSFSPGNVPHYRATLS